MREVSAAFFESQAVADLDLCPAVLPEVLAVARAFAKSKQSETPETTKGGKAMMLAAIVSCTVLAIVAFSIGFVCGKDVGRQQSEAAAAAKLLAYRFAARRYAQPIHPGPFPANRIIREGTTGGGTFPGHGLRG